jgi:hypothetical protein
MVAKLGRRPNKQGEIWGLLRTEYGGKYVDLSLMKQQETGGGNVTKNCMICWK